MHKNSVIIILKTLAKLRKSIIQNTNNILDTSLLTFKIYLFLLQVNIYGKHA